VTIGLRGLALTAGVLLGVGGIALWANGGGPMLLIVSVLVLVTAALEPFYGRTTGRPMGANWRATDEKFVDPDTGALVTVWFNPESGERRYVADGQHN
jgi:hypothetical protein